MGIRKDIHNNIKALTGLYPRTINSNTTTAGSIIDMQGYRSLEFVLTAGTITDGTYVPLIEESDDSGMSGAVAIVAPNLIGSTADATHTSASTQTTKKIGISMGNKRYIRLSIVSTGTSSGGVIGATAILGTPQLVPTS